MDAEVRVGQYHVCQLGGYPRRLAALRLGRRTKVRLFSPGSSETTSSLTANHRAQNDRFAGNGGLSLRRISTVKRILGFQSRYNDTEPEDEWFGKRITVLPGAKVASGTEESHLSVEDTFFDRPMGYHVRDGGENLAEDVWMDPKKRKANFEYCPELAMIMPMKLERERCQGDNKMGMIDTPQGVDPGEE